MSNSKIRIYYWRYCNNFGDELSEYIVYKLTGEHPELVKNNDLNKLLAVGSIITNKSLYTNSLIWGSGFLTEGIRIKLKVFPLTYFFSQLYRSFVTKTKIYALRGPLSKSKIESQTFGNLLNDRMFVDRANCVFGDPALLLPLLYEGNSNAHKNKIGIILHHIQPISAELEQKLSSAGIKLISIFRDGYEAIESFVDEVCSCDKVFSSSLHGIIVAQAYGIPAQWLQLEESPVQNHEEFKFRDYFLGAGLEIQKPLRVSFEQDIDATIALLDSFDVKKVDMDLAKIQKRLLNAFPFPDKLKIEVK